MYVVIIFTVSILCGGNRVQQSIETFRGERIDQA